MSNILAVGSYFGSVNCIVSSQKRHFFQMKVNMFDGTIHVDVTHAQN